jgi:hypothetical protein
MSKRWLVVTLALAPIVLTAQDKPILSSIRSPRIRRRVAIRPQTTARATRRRIQGDARKRFQVMAEAPASGAGKVFTLRLAGC